MNNLNFKKTGSQPAKIDTACQKALDKAIGSNTSSISNREIPNALNRLASDCASKRLIRLVYNCPLVTTHEIHKILGVSNSHDISKKLAKRLEKAGYKFEKLPLSGTKKPHHWLLREVEHGR